LATKVAELTSTRDSELGELITSDISLTKLPSDYTELAGHSVPALEAYILRRYGPDVKCGMMEWSLPWDKSLHPETKLFSSTLYVGEKRQYTGRSWVSDYKEIKLTAEEYKIKLLSFLKTHYCCECSVLGHKWTECPERLKDVECKYCRTKDIIRRHAQVWFVLIVVFKDILLNIVQKWCVRFVKSKDIIYLCARIRQS